MAEELQAEELQTGSGALTLEEPALASPSVDGSGATYTEENTHTVRLEDIQNSPTLRKMAATPGDIIKDGKLQRVHSKPEDVGFGGDTITRATLIANPWMIEEGAEIGDILRDGEIIKTGYDDVMEQFKYSFDRASNEFSTDTFYAYGAAHSPYSEGVRRRVGYSPAFDEGDYATRVEQVKAAKERAILDEYGYDFVERGGAANVAGELTKMLATPTTLLPVGQTVKAASLIGAGVGTLASVSQQLKDGEVGVTETILGASIGSLLGGGTAKLFNRSSSETATNAINHLMLDSKGRTLSGTAARLRLTDLIGNGKVTRQQATDYAATQARRVHERADDDFVFGGAFLGDVTGKSKGGLRDAYQILGTELSRVHPALGQAMKKYEINIAHRISDTMRRAKPFFDDLEKVSNATRSWITQHVYRGEFDEAVKLMSPAMQKNWKALLSAQDELTKLQRKAGYKFGNVKNYFHREMQDVEGFRAAVGRKPGSARTIEQLDLYAKVMGKSANTLSVEETNKALNMIARGYSVNAKKGSPQVWVKSNADKAPGFTKQRTVANKDINDDTIQFYASLSESFERHIGRAVHDLEKRRFFGRFVNKASDDPDGYLDLDGTIGAMMRETLEGNIDSAQVTRAEELLRARFEPGAQPVGALQRKIQELGYVGTLANPATAIVQLTDLATSGAMYGLRNTVAAMFGRKNMRLIDTGYDDIVHDLAHHKGTGRAFINKLFSLSGFRAVDRFSKETVINAAFNKGKALAKNPKGISKLQRDYKYFFNKDFDQFVDDLANGRNTELTRQYATSELLNIQPLAPSQMPVWWNTNPTGRLFYMLKSFTLKQYDIVRREVIHEAKHNPAEAAKKAFALGTYMMLAGTPVHVARDFMLGREVDPDELPATALWNLAGVYGGNKYLVDRYLARGDIAGAAVAYFAPPLPLVQDAGGAATDVIKYAADGEGDIDEALLKRTRSVPVIGPLVYYHFGGGAERYNEKR